MDPRTLPQNYGPVGYGPKPPMTDGLAPLRDALAGVDPEMAHLVNSLGNATRNRDSSAGLIDLALKGENMDTLHGQVIAADAAEQAREMAEETIDMDDSQFEALMGQLANETNMMPDMPTRGAYEQPSHLESAVAALTGILNPEFAFDAGAAPYRVSAQRREERYAEAQDRFKWDTQRRNDRMDLLKMRISEQTRRDMAVLQERTRRGDKLAGDVQTAIARILSANRPGEATLAWQELYRLDPSRAAAYKTQVDQIEAEATEKAADERATAAANRDARRLQYDAEWRRMTEGNLKFYGGFSDEEARYYNEVLRPEYEKGAGRPLPPVKSGATMAREAAAFSKQKWSQQFDFAKKAHGDRMAMAKANYELAKQRLVVAQRNGDTAAFNAETARMNALRLAATAEYESGPAKEFSDVQTKIAEIEAKLAKAEALGEDTSKYEIDLAPLYDKRQAFYEEFGEFMEVGVSQGGGVLPQINVTFPGQDNPLKGNIPQGPQPKAPTAKPKVKQPKYGAATGATFGGRQTNRGVTRSGATYEVLPD